MTLVANFRVCEKSRLRKNLQQDAESTRATDADVSGHCAMVNTISEAGGVAGAGAGPDNPFKRCQYLMRPCLLSPSILQPTGELLSAVRHHHQMEAGHLGYNSLYRTEVLVSFCVLPLFSFLIKIQGVYINCHEQI